LFRTYEIRGSHPQYKIPEPTGGRIENKLPKNVEKQLLRKSISQKQRNFLRENMKAAKTKADRKSPTGSRSKF
jgi:hypothetical protein